MIPAWFLRIIGVPSFISELYQSGQTDGRTTHVGKWQPVGVCPLDCRGAELFRPWLPSLALFIQRNSLSFSATDTLSPGGSRSRSAVVHHVDGSRTISPPPPRLVSSQEGNTSDPVSVFLNHCTLKLQNIVLSGPLSPQGLTPHSGSFLEFCSHTLISVRSSRQVGWLCCQLELQGRLVWSQRPQNRNTEARCQDSNTGALSFNS